MEGCKLNFTPQDNALAHDLYKKLIQEGASCSKMDIGYSVANYAGIHCPDKTARSCTIGAQDGVVNPEEVFEYGLNSYERYRKLLEGVFKFPIPWVLDDMDPATTDDAGIRERVQKAIECLKDILKKNGVKEGTEAYKERLAVGLFWLAALPAKEALKIDKLASFKVETKTSAKLTAILDMAKGDLKANSLSDFWDYLVQNGGFYIEGDYSAEYDALTALRKNSGECTENSKILFAIFKMAGLDPVFVQSGDQPKLIEDLKGFKLARYFMDEINNIPPGLDHVYIGHRFDGRLRSFDPSFFNSAAGYRDYYPLSLRQYLSGDITNRGATRTEPFKAIADYNLAIEINPKYAEAYNNRGFAWREKGEIDKAIADFTRAIEINPKLAEAYNNRGVAWREKGEFDKAIADYNLAIEINPKLAEAYYNRGNALCEKGEFDKAIADYNLAIEINPKLAEAYAGRGLSYVAKGQYPKAVADFSTLFSLAQPSLDTVIAPLSNLLEIAWQKNDKMQAVTTAFSKATGMDLTRTTAYFILSYALWNAGRRDEAKKAFETLSLALPEKIPLPALKFFGEMLALMPPDMKKDEDVKAAAKFISGKHR